MASTDPHFRLRLPADLHERLTQEAYESERSINAEIVFRLRQSFAKNTSKLDKIDEHIMRIRTEIASTEHTLERTKADRENLEHMLSEALELRRRFEDEAKAGAVKDE